MTTFDFSDVEAFLDCHPDLFEEYLLRKGKSDAVGRWLKEHQPSKASTAEEKHGGPRDPFLPSNPDGLRRRSSHVELRRNFARSKATTAHRTYDEHVSLSEHESQSSMRRRALLRKASSLPPTTAHILSALLESRVNVPQYASSAIDYKYRLKETNEREFFLELVKDISNDLDLTNLSYKILINVCILVDADRCSLFLVEGPAHKRTLVSKFFDVHSGTTVRPSSSTVNSNEVQVPWGKGIIGYVAEHGETVNVPNAYEVRYTRSTIKVNMQCRTNISLHHCGWLQTNCKIQNKTGHADVWMLSLSRPSQIKKTRDGIFNKVAISRKWSETAIRPL